MAEVIRMPLLSDTMKEGVIADWNVKVGDKISADDPIAEVETDKATMEVIPYVEGTVLYIGPKKGEAAKVNEVIAIVGEEGESYEDLLKEEKTSGDSEEKKETEKSEKEGEKKEEKEGEANKTEKGAKSEKRVDKGALEEAEKNATAIRMPLLSDTMKEGKIVSWNVKEGEEVGADDVLAEVETDKATMEVIGYVDGTLLHIGVPEGEAAKINSIIAIVGKEGTDIQPILDAENRESEDKKEEEQPKEDAAGEKTPAKEKKDTSKKKSKTKEGRIKASPLARKMAEEKGIDLEDIDGSGDSGRIIKRDIDGYKPQQKTAKSTTAPSFAPAGEEGYEDKPFTQMRKTIGRRLSESKFNAPHFYLTVELNMDKAMRVRKEMNEISPVKISFNDLIIKASAMAL